MNTEVTNVFNHTNPIKNKEELTLMFNKLMSYDYITVDNLVSYTQVKVSFLKLLEESLPLHSSEKSLGQNISKINYKLMELNSNNSWQSKKDPKRKVPLVKKDNYVQFQFYSAMKDKYVQMLRLLYKEQELKAYINCDVYSFEDIEEGLFVNYAQNVSEEELCALNAEAQEKINSYLNSKVSLW